MLDLNSTKMQPHLLVLAVKHVCSSILAASVEGVDAALRGCAAWVDTLSPCYPDVLRLILLTTGKCVLQNTQNISYTILFSVMQLSPISLSPFLVWKYKGTQNIEG